MEILDIWFTLIRQRLIIFIYILHILLLSDPSMATMELPKRSKQQTATKDTTYE